MKAPTVEEARKGIGFTRHFANVDFLLNKRPAAIDAVRMTLTDRFDWEVEILGDMPQKADLLTLRAESKFCPTYDLEIHNLEHLKEDTWKARAVTWWHIKGSLLTWSEFKEKENIEDDWLNLPEVEEGETYPVIGSLPSSPERATIGGWYSHMREMREAAKKAFKK